MSIFRSLRKSVDTLFILIKRSTVKVTVSCVTDLFWILTPACIIKLFYNSSIGIALQGSLLTLGLTGNLLNPKLTRSHIGFLQI